MGVLVDSLNLIPQAMVSADMAMAHQINDREGSDTKNPAGERRGVGYSRRRHTEHKDFTCRSRGREVPPASEFLPLDADALILVALSSYHHVSLIQNEHFDLLGVNELELGAPVQNGPRGANDNVLTDLLTSFHCGDKMFSVGTSMAKPALEIKAVPILPGLEQINSRLQNTLSVILTSWILLL
uniref:Uncharacterized protein n=1 Tax=Equus caballus TaxID=9796 RepID=A0A3Q2HI84_HORSE